MSRVLGIDEAANAALRRFHDDMSDVVLPDDLARTDNARRAAARQCRSAMSSLGARGDRPDLTAFSFRAEAHDRAFTQFRSICEIAASSASLSTSALSTIRGKIQHGESLISQASSESVARTPFGERAQP